MRVGLGVGLEAGLGVRVLVQVGVLVGLRSLDKGVGGGQGERYTFGVCREPNRGSGLQRRSGICKGEGVPLEGHVECCPVGNL